MGNCKVCSSELDRKSNFNVICCSCTEFYNKKVSCPPEKCNHANNKELDSCPSCKFAKCSSFIKPERIENLNSYNSDSYFVERIIFCESLIEPSTETTFSEEFVQLEAEINPFDMILMAMENRLTKLNYWASVMPWFSTDLVHIDRVVLIKHSWMEIILLSLSHRSSFTNDALLFFNENSKSIPRFAITRTVFTSMGLGSYADRILNQLVRNLRDLALDRIELCLVRASLLFNPECPGLSEEAKTLIESFRDKIYSAINIYCSQSKAIVDTSRFTKILMKLNQIKPVALKCVEYLVLLESISKDKNYEKILTLIREGTWN